MKESSAWHIQYGPWDVRLGCPWCGQWETFFCTILDVDEALVVAGFVCGGHRGCGHKEPVKLIELLNRPDGRVGQWETAVINSVNREASMLKLIRGKPVGSDLKVYERAKELFKAKGIEWPLTEYEK